MKTIFHHTRFYFAFFVIIQCFCFTKHSYSGTGQFYSDPVVITVSGSEEIASAIKSGNSAALARFFNNTIDLVVPGNEITCSKTQAEQIMRDFFNKNQPKTFKINHQGASRDGSQYFIGTYTSTKGKSYRTYFLMKKVGDAQFIQQLQFEEE